MKKVLLLLLVFISMHSFSQDGSILKFIKGSDTKPLIIYLTGDGGMNKFSVGLTNGINSNGYSLLVLDSKSYFWKKKTPQQLANDVNSAVEAALRDHSFPGLIFMGYSFGADVTPFLVNRLTAALQAKTQQVVLLSPSAYSNFEIKLTDMFGWNSSKGADVVAEINSYSKPMVLFFGKEENEFPQDKLNKKNKKVILLEGGHRYANDASKLTKQVLLAVQ